MPILTCIYAEGIFGVLNIKFTNGYLKLTEKQFEAMVNKDKEYFEDLVRREVIVVMRPGAPMPDKSHKVAVHKADGATAPMPVPAIMGRPVTNIPVVRTVAEVGETIPGVDTETIVEEDATTAPPSAGALDASKITKTQEPIIGA